MDDTNQGTQEMERKMNLSIMTEPQLVVKIEDGKPIWQDNVLKDLEELRSLDLHTVAMVGPHRTGKSWLLTRLMGFSKGFEVGHTMSSVTKGIWLWCRQHPRIQKHVIVMLDTEGLLDSKKPTASQDDSIIVVLSLLLSNTLLYNAMRTLDSTTIANLDYMATFVQKTIDTSKKLFRQDQFILVLRDAMELDPGQSYDEFLEDILNANSTSNDDIKSQFRTHFPRRKCVGMSCPSTGSSTSAMRNLEHLDTKELTDSFQQNLLELKEAIDSTESMGVDGPGYVALIKRYCEAICDDSVCSLPSFKSIRKNICREGNEKALQSALGTYKEQFGCMNAEEGGNLTIDKRHELAYNNARQVLEEGLFGDDTKQTFLDKFEKKISKQFYEMVEKDCKCKLDKLAKTYIKDKATYISEGLNAFKNDFDVLRKEFFQIQGNTAQTAQEFDKFALSLLKFQFEIMQEEEMQTSTQGTREGISTRQLVAEFASTAFSILFTVKFGAKGGIVSMMALQTMKSLTTNMCMNMGKGQTLQEFIETVARSTAADIYDPSLLRRMESDHIAKDTPRHCAADRKNSI